MEQQCPELRNRPPIWLRIGPFPAGVYHPCQTPGNEAHCTQPALKVANSGSRGPTSVQPQAG
eukprot:9320264-Pyramimonas_sp.AAC.1